MCDLETTQVVVGAEYDENDVFVQYVTANIEDIEIGDLVYSCDTATGEVSLKPVTDVFVRETDHLDYLTIVDENGETRVLETTDSHPFWVVTDEPDLSRAARSVVDENGVWLYHENVGPTENGYWVEAKDLREGDVFLGANGELSTLVSRYRVEYPDGITVYNFTVEGNHDYYVIAEGEYGTSCILVHNAEYARRFMGRQEYKNVKKKGLEFDPAKGNGIPTTTTNIDPVNPDAIKAITGAEKRDYFIDFDITDVKTLVTKTKSGNTEIRLLESVPPSKIVAHGRVESGYPGN